MPFDSNGAYSLPQSAFVPGTPISSSAVNSDFDDIASALTTAYQAALASAPPGLPQLSTTGSSLLLSANKGNSIIISGNARTISSSGVSYSLLGLSANTTYYIYAYWTGTNINLVASTTGHSADPSTGVEVKSDDSSRSLVGLMRTTSANTTVNSAAQRLICSWFQDGSRSLTGTSFTDTSASAAIGELDSGNGRAQWVQFANRAGIVSFQGYCSNNNSGRTVNTGIGIDQTAAVSTPNLAWVTAAANQSAPFNAAYALPNLAEGFHFAAPLGSTSANTGSWTGQVVGWVT